MPRRLLPLAALALLGAACVAPGAAIPEDDPTGGLQQPTFTPLDTEGPAPGSPSTDVTSTESSAQPTPPPTTSPTATATENAPSSSASPAPTGPSPTASTPPPPPATRRGVIVDGTGDLRGVGRSGAPAHADLRQVALEVAADTATITIGFAGPAPEQGEGDDILNVATYHDVTGDGSVDYEIWASLTADGWGTSWYDIRNGTARFAADDQVEVEVVDGLVVLTFPPSHLGGARSGQWLASSEWGSAVTISSGTSVTDDAPDDRSGRAWPS